MRFFFLIALPALALAPSGLRPSNAAREAGAGSNVNRLALGSSANPGGIGAPSRRSCRVGDPEGGKGTVQERSGKSLCSFRTGPALAAQEPGKKLLRLRLTPGETVSFRIREEEQSVAKPLGREVKSSQVAQFDVRMKVEEVDDQGAARVRWKFTRVIYESSDPQRETRYDSADPDAEPQGYAVVLAAMVGCEVVLRVHPDGSGEGIEGGKELQEKILKALDESADPQAEAYRAVILSKQSGAWVRQSAGGVFQALPRQEVGVGDSWSEKGKTVNTGILFVQDNTFKIVGWKDGRVRVECRAKVRSDAEGKAVETKGAKVAADLQGDGKGEYEIDESKGWVVRSEYRQKLAGTMSVTLPGSDAPMEFEISVESVKTQTLLEEEY